MSAEVPSPLDWHNVNLKVSAVRAGAVMRSPHQNIKAVINGRLSVEQAREFVELLQTQLHEYEDGKGPITFTLEGEFT